MTDRQKQRERERNRKRDRVEDRGKERERGRERKDIELSAYPCTAAPGLFCLASGELRVR